MTPSPPPKPLPDTPILLDFPPLMRNRNFLLLGIGPFISALGDRIQFVVALYLLSRQIMGIPEPGTQQTAQLTIAMLSPFVLLGPFAGVLADRLPRRKVMIAADFSRALIIIVVRTLFVEFHETMSPWTMGALLFSSEFMMSIFAAMFSPAKSALMPNLVHQDQLLRATSLTAAAGTIASLVGFVVGGALIDFQVGGNMTVGAHTPSPTIAMYAGAVTFILSAICLLLMKISRQAASGISASKPKMQNVFSEFADGIRYIRNHKRTLQIIILMLLFWGCATVIFNGLSGIVTIHYGLNLKWYTFFMGMLGAAMVLGASACLLARRGIPKEIGIAWAMVGVGVFLGLFSVVQTTWLGVTFLMAGAFMGAMMLVSLDTLLARITPNYVRGRVMGVKDLIATAGLVSAAVPLAFLDGIDQHIRLVLTCMSVLVTIVGVGLVITYYRAQHLPLGVAIARRAASAYLSVWKSFKPGNACRIPTSGPVIFVSNHTAAFDPLVMQSASKRRHVRFMMAKEYYQQKPLVWFYKSVGVIPVNRSGNDTASIRTALRALQDGECIGMYPEGKISLDGKLGEGRQGVALLALMSGATVVPSYITGNNAHSDMLTDFLKRNRVSIYFGRPLRFDDLKGRDEVARDEATRRIMDAIIALRDRYETDPQRRVGSSASVTAEVEKSD